MDVLLQHFYTSEISNKREWRIQAGLFNFLDLLILMLGWLMPCVASFGKSQTPMKKFRQASGANW